MSANRSLRRRWVAIGDQLEYRYRSEGAWTFDHCTPGQRGAEFRKVPVELPHVSY